MAPTLPTPGYGMGQIGTKNPQLVCRQLAMPSVWHMIPSADRAAALQ